MKANGEKLAAAEGDPVVYVRRQWNDTFEGTVKLSQIGRLHWSDVSGGVGASAPRAFLHGYVWCTDIVGNISHSCRHGPPPHSIKVCVVKKRNLALWPRLLARVEQPAKTRTP